MILALLLAGSWWAIVGDRAEPLISAHGSTLQLCGLSSERE